MAASKSLSLNSLKNKKVKADSIKLPKEIPGLYWCKGLPNGELCVSDYKNFWMVKENDANKNSMDITQIIEPILNLENNAEQVKIVSIALIKDALFIACDTQVGGNNSYVMQVDRDGNVKDYLAKGWFYQLTTASGDSNTLYALRDSPLRGNNSQSIS